MVKSMLINYVGPSAAPIIVVDRNAGQDIVFTPGEPVEVPEGLGKLLLAQPTNFEEVAGATASVETVSEEETI